MPDNGLITVPSAHSVKDSLDRLETGIKTPRAEVDLIRERLKRLREMLR